MSKINVCPACNAKKNGVKSRIAFPHTCGLDRGGGIAKMSAVKAAEMSRALVALDCYATITFEDHGQDFLRWQIDRDGKIISCEPFQFSIWSKYIVLNKRFKVGGYITIVEPTEGRKMTVKYPIENIQLQSL